MLKETDTIWMFILPGTCKEIVGAEEVQRAAKKEVPKKKDSSNGTDDGKEDAENEAKPEKEAENTEDKPEKEKVEEKDQVEETEKSKELKEEQKSYLKHKYDLNEKWSQTIDFPRKKKGTQSDPIQTHDSFAQVTSKDLLL